MLTASSPFTGEATPAPATSRSAQRVVYSSSVALFYSLQHRDAQAVGLSHCVLPAMNDMFVHDQIERG